MSEVQVGEGSRSRASLAILGVLTFWPPLYMLLFFVVIASSILWVSSGSSSEPGVFALIVPLHLLTMLEMLGLTVYYAFSVYRDPDVQGDRKLLWMIIVLLGGFVGQAVYYVLWMVKRHPTVIGSVSSTPPAVATTPTSVPDAG